jgi:heterodisulfide reductase subunit D
MKSKKGLSKMKNASFAKDLTPSQLMELDACTMCGQCLKYCPVQDVTGNPLISPPEKIRIFREFIKSTEGLKARLFGRRGQKREVENRKGI